jgi:ribosomal protein S18 acetylase RimI-like enzyme
MSATWDVALHDRCANLNVRACTSLGDVAAIEDTLPSGPSQFHRRRFELSDGSVYLLAWIDDVAVGHVLVTPESKYPEIRAQLGRLPEVNGLGVADAYRRKGVARALMAEAVKIASGQGCDRLGLAVEPDNEPAVRLYEALGFERRNLEVVDVWAWLDEDGHEHEERDPCVYWTLAVGG